MVYGDLRACEELGEVRRIDGGGVRCPMIGKAIGLGGRRALVLVLWNMARTRMVETSHTRKSMM